MIEAMQQIKIFKGTSQRKLFSIAQILNYFQVNSRNILLQTSNHPL